VRAPIRPADRPVPANFRTRAGTVYVVFVVDTFSRRIVGWSAATSKATPLVLGALEMGLWQRDRAGQEHEGLIHHSDAGS
jgi:putative transposase